MRQASTAKVKPKPPHAFVLEALASLRPEVKQMFSGYAVYVGDLLVFMLREHRDAPQDNGVWLVLSETIEPDDAGLRREFSSLRKIAMLGAKVGHWRLIPSDGLEFETEALRACELVLRRDSRVGRVPRSRQ